VRFIPLDREIDFTIPRIELKEPLQ
jgi:hypothetical protein